MTQNNNNKIDGENVLENEATIFMTADKNLTKPYPEKDQKLSKSLLQCPPRCYPIEDGWKYSTNKSARN